MIEGSDAHPLENQGRWPGLPIGSLLACTWILAIASVGQALLESQGEPLPATRCAVNPNEAPWWELTILPEIGPALARKIVGLRERLERERGPDFIVFLSEKDLDAVAGIGPKKLRRIAPFVRFEPPARGRPGSSAGNDHPG